MGMSILTCGESLNMGVQTISGVEWCLAARARVWVPLTARSPPFAKTVCVPMMTCRERDIKTLHSGTPMFWDKLFLEIPR